MKEKHERFIYDGLIAISLIFFLTVHVVTMYAIGKTAEVTGKNIEKVTKVIEKNPFAQWLFNLERINKIVKLFVAPALVLASYMALRFLPGVKNITLRFVSVFMVALSTINVTNDLALFIGTFG